MKSDPGSSDSLNPPVDILDENQKIHPTQRHCRKLAVFSILTVVAILLSVLIPVMILNKKPENVRLAKEKYSGGRPELRGGMNNTRLIRHREIVHGNEKIGFDHIYVISASSERENYIKRILNYHHVEYELFQAHLNNGKIVANTVDHKEKDFSSLKTKNSPDWSSHKAVWEDAIKRNFSTVLFLEDDIDIRIDLIQKMKVAWKQIPDDWQMVMLGYCFADFDDSSGSPDQSKMVQRIQSADCMHAYGVKQELFPFLLDISTTEAVDVNPVESGLFQVYGVVPHVINQTPITLHRNSVMNWRTNIKNQGDRLLKDDWRRDEQYELDKSTAHQVGLDYWMHLTE